MDADLVGLEGSIKAIPGVLGCVILANADGTAAEIQAFIRLGTQPEEVRDAVMAHVSDQGLEEKLRDVFVFELDAESEFGDRESLERAAELAEQEARSRGPASDWLENLPPTEVPTIHLGIPRTPLRRVVLTSTHWTSEAEVELGEDESVIGTAAGEKTPHGLKVLGEAALEAVGKLMPAVAFRFEGASLVSVIGREAVMVLVRIDDLETVGAALLRDGPATEAAVRATLDAVNRRMERGS